MVKKRPTHGGARPGAGKKPGKHGAKQRVQLWLTPDVVAFLQTQESPGHYVDAAVRRSAAFRKLADQTKP